MFTGIVSDTATITQIEPNASGVLITLQLSNSITASLGDSVALDGACHSIVSINSNTLSFFSSTETLATTIVQHYKIGQLVNIEQPLQLQQRLDGHMVSGHVDCMGEVTICTHTADTMIVGITIPATFQKYIVYKGSVTVNGASLTINKIEENTFWLYLIPITVAATNLKYLAQGSSVNIEVDMLGKYVESLLKKSNYV